MAEKEETKTKERFEIVEVPTKTGFFVKDNKSGEVWEDKKVLTEILNKLERIEKSVI